MDQFILTLGAVSDMLLCFIAVLDFLARHEIAAASRGIKHRPALALLHARKRSR